MLDHGFPNFVGRGQPFVNLFLKPNLMLHQLFRPNSELLE